MTGRASGVVLLVLDAGTNSSAPPSRAASGQRCASVGFRVQNQQQRTARPGVSE